MNLPPALRHPLSGPALMLAVLAIAAILLRPLTPIDETRYISVAWEMWLRGDYLVMFKNGEPYSHKPPLLFWIYNLGWAITGVNEWWPRLVSPLFSLGCLGLTLAIGRQLWPEDNHVTRQALWILASCQLWMLFSTSGMFDVMLTFFVLLGIRGLLIASRDAMRAGFLWLAVAIGFGLLAKGPVVLLHLLPAALLAPWWAPGQAWKQWYAGILLAVLGGAAIALLWAIPAALQGGEEYRQMIFWGQTANRMVDSFAHKRGIKWYLPLLPFLFFPWLTWPRLWRQVVSRDRQPLDNSLRFCLAWLLPVFIVLSLISGKQIHYLIPLFPVVALLIARLTSSSARGGLWLPMLISTGAALGMLYLSHAKHLPGMLKGWERMPWWPGAVMLAGIIVAWIAARNRPTRQVPIMAITSAALFFMGQSLVSGNLWLRYDVRPFAVEIRKLQDQGIPVASFNQYHAQFQFFGRLEKSIDYLATTEDVAAWFQQHPDGILFAYIKKPRPAPVRFRRPYAGEYGMLMDATQAREQRLSK